MPVFWEERTRGVLRPEGRAQDDRVKGSGSKNSTHIGNVETAEGGDRRPETGLRSAACKTAGR